VNGGKTSGPVLLSNMLGQGFRTKKTLNQVRWRRAVLFNHCVHQDPKLCLCMIYRRAGATPLTCGSSCCATCSVMRAAAGHCCSAALQPQQHLLSSCWRSLQPHWQRSWQRSRLVEVWDGVEGWYTVTRGWGCYVDVVGLLGL
jgi:hypothetical protein